MHNLLESFSKKNCNVVIVKRKYRSNYATKSDLKIATGVDVSKFAKKDDLANLNLETGELDIDYLVELDADKLKPVFADLKKIRNIVAKIKNIEDKIPSITNLATNSAVNA